MTTVTVRGIVYEFDNIKWAPAEYDVGIMGPYVDEFDLLDPEGIAVPSSFWDSLTTQELQNIHDAADQIEYEPDDDY